MQTRLSTLQLHLHLLNRGSKNDVAVFSRGSEDELSCQITSTTFKHNSYNIN